MGVGVGGTGVPNGVGLGGTGVSVGGLGVNVAVGGSGVAVGGTAVDVAVGVSGTGVVVGVCCVGDMVGDGGMDVAVGVGDASAGAAESGVPAAPPSGWSINTVRGVAALAGSVTGIASAVVLSGRCCVILRIPMIRTSAQPPNTATIRQGGCVMHSPQHGTTIVSSQRKSGSLTWRSAVVIVGR